MQSEFKAKWNYKTTFAAIIYHNDELSSSLSWFDCLQTDSEVVILSAKITQILLKISFIPILLTLKDMGFLVS